MTVETPKGHPVRVKISYKPRNPDELHLREGAVIRSLSIVNKDWSMGYDPTANRYGIFPTRFVDKDSVSFEPDLIPSFDVLASKINRQLSLQTDILLQPCLTEFVDIAPSSECMPPISLSDEEEEHYSSPIDDDVNELFFHENEVSEKTDFIFGKVKYRGEEAHLEVDTKRCDLIVIQKKHRFMFSLDRYYVQVNNDSFILYGLEGKFEFGEVTVHVANWLKEIGNDVQELEKMWLHPRLLSESDVMYLWKQVPGNDTCADCGAEYPTWAVVNLGILVCVECCGVHRSLGVHISKVRSLTLDMWTEPQLILMKSLGNKVVNSVFLGCDNPVIDPVSSRYHQFGLMIQRELREEVIICKYKDCSFLKPFQDTSVGPKSALQNVLVKSPNLQDMIYDACINYSFAIPEIILSNNYFPPDDLYVRIKSCKDICQPMKWYMASWKGKKKISATPSSSGDDEIIRPPFSGYVFKRGGMNTNFQKRFFVLDRFGLKYARTAQEIDTNPCGFVPFNQLIAMNKSFSIMPMSFSIISSERVFQCFVEQQYCLRYWSKAFEWVDSFRYWSRYVPALNWQFIKYRLPDRKDVQEGYASIFNNWVVIIDSTQTFVVSYANDVLRYVENDKYVLGNSIEEENNCIIFSPLSLSRADPIEPTQYLLIQVQRPQKKDYVQFKAKYHPSHTVVHFVQHIVSSMDLPKSNKYQLILNFQANFRVIGDHLSMEGWMKHLPQVYNIRLINSVALKIPGWTSYQGWLLKRGQTNPEWKRRYFVLLGDSRLFYYKQLPSQSLPQGCWLIQPHKVWGLDSVEVQQPRSSFCQTSFAISIEVGKCSRIIGAQSEEDRYNWLLAFSRL